MNAGDSGVNFRFHLSTRQVAALRDHLAVVEVEAGRATAGILLELHQAAVLSLGFAADATPQLQSTVQALALATPATIDAPMINRLWWLAGLLDAQRSAAPRGRILQALGLVGWR